MVSSAMSVLGVRGTLLQLLEAVTDGTVDHGVADVGDDAAEHGRVDDDLDLDLLAGGRAEGSASGRAGSSSGTAGGPRRPPCWRSAAASSTKRSTMAGSRRAGRCRPATTRGPRWSAAGLAAEEVLDDLLARSAGSAGSVSASRSSSVPSRVRAKRNSSSSTSPRCPRPGRPRASLGRSRRAVVGHRPARQWRRFADLVDVAARRAGSGCRGRGCARRRLLGQLDGQVGDLAPQVGDGPALAASMSACAGSRISASSASARGCCSRDASAAWRASSMIRPASAWRRRAGAGTRPAPLLGLGLGRLGALEVAADASRCVRSSSS